MKIDVEQCPYYEDEKLYDYKTVNFPLGLTVLVGRNGSGKTTLIKQIERKVEKRKGYTLIKFDNYNDGGSQSVNDRLFHGDMDTVAALWTASEGQRIGVNVGNTISVVGRAIRNMKPKEKLVVLMDAVDSGLSLDTIVEVKEVFDLIVNDCKEREIEAYIIVSANGYEFPNGSNCLDITSGKFVTFENYDEYRNYILKDKSK